MKNKKGQIATLFKFLFIIGIIVFVIMALSSGTLTGMPWWIIIGIILLIIILYKKK